MHWREGKKVIGEGQMFLETVTVVWLLVAAVAIVLLLLAWDCMLYDCIVVVLFVITCNMMSVNIRNNVSELLYISYAHNHITAIAGQSVLTDDPSYELDVFIKAKFCYLHALAVSI